MSDHDIMERLIGEAKAGRLELPELAAEFLGLSVALPSSTDPSEAGVTPVFVDIEGVPFMVVAASTEALRKTAALAGFAVTKRAADIVSGIAPGLGLLVHTVHDTISFAPEILDDLRAGTSA
ncbi:MULTISPECIES: hypothetical protein [unclassified Leucobacter]|uniref:hypothetical protein n=1 Tax=unclassified Leucobacter TaxID=2621730 RepID=UPI00165D6E6B|nr:MULTISPECIES: hypothetical protein [unclassified Leucobacter]MBC9925964.1 hypothetical protein [Leucobacter sp. cx-169]